MPNLVGMAWEEANEKYGEYLTLVFTQEYSDVEKDHIIEHDPPVGRRVKLGQTVAVTVSNGRRMSEIFDFKGRQASYAIQQLEREGFKTTTTSAVDDTIPKDCVISTTPPAHTMAEQGTTVTVIISMGPKNSSVEVPTLTGNSIDEAQKICNESYLVPTTKLVSSELPEGTVIEQSIEPGKMVDRNTTIELTVSSGEVPTVTANLDIAIPAGVTGEFEFRYFIDGKLQNTAEPDIRDVSLSSNRTISYKIDGRVDETQKVLEIKVISQSTGKDGLYMKIVIDFSQDPPKEVESSSDPSIFLKLQQK